MSDFNIQFFSYSGSTIDHNINFYAEDDAAGVNLWDEDDCVATLLRKDDVWVVARVNGFYSMRDDALESDDYPDVVSFIERLENILETV